MNLITKLFALSLTTVTCSLIGQQTDEELAAAASIPQPSARALIEQARDDYLARAGLSQGTTNPNGAYIGWGNAPVSVGPESPAWGRARIAAFETALLQAQGSFIQFQFSRILTESTRTLFEDDSYGLPEQPASEPEVTKGRLRAMFSKLLAIGDAKLNSKLEEMGLNPEDFEPPPNVSREDHYSEKLLQTTVTRSYGSLAGLLPLQTFEGKDGRGNHLVGVLVVYSPNFRQLAHEVATGTGKLVNVGKAARPLVDQLPKSGEVLHKQFGVRRFFDENGMSVIAAFGQEAIIDRGGNERRLDRQRDTALTRARMNADAALAMFAKGNLSLNNESVTGQIIEEYTLKTSGPKGFTSLVENTGFISQLTEETERRATLEISGLQDFTTWTYTHPETGHELVGVVRIWSPASKQAAQALKEFRPEADKPEPARGQAPKTGKPGVQQGGLPVNVSDF
jgi:hypothetical protein